MMRAALQEHGDDFVNVRYPSNPGSAAGSPLNLNPPLTSRF